MPDPTILAHLDAEVERIKAQEKPTATAQIGIVRRASDLPSDIVERCAKWREKYPRRFLALRMYVALREASPQQRQKIAKGETDVMASTWVGPLCEPLENEILAVVLTDPPEPVDSEQDT